MTDHKIGTRAEWQAARDKLAKLEAENAKQNEEIKKKRLELPWVPVEKQYEFETDTGRKTLADLFDGARSSSPIASCSGPTTSSAPAPDARAWWTISTPPRCTSDTGT